ncbi:hypothetical protein GCM10011338_08440 [Alteromonas lipolytica]|nr:hypothetical protein GCM10011338_08440 [Alteromonas lipolytica]
MSIFDVDDDGVTTGGDLAYRHFDLQSGNIYGSDALDFYSTIEQPYNIVPDLTIELNKVAKNDILTSTTNYFQIGAFLEGPRDVSGGKNAMGLWGGADGPVVTLNINYDTATVETTTVAEPILLPLLGMGLVSVFLVANRQYKKH